MTNPVLYAFLSIHFSFLFSLSPIMVFPLWLMKPGVTKSQFFLEEICTNAPKNNYAQLISNLHGEKGNTEKYNGCHCGAFASILRHSSPASSFLKSFLTTSSQLVLPPVDFNVVFEAS